MSGRRILPSTLQRRRLPQTSVPPTCGNNKTHQPLSTIQVTLDPVAMVPPTLSLPPKVHVDKQTIPDPSLWATTIDRSRTCSRYDSASSRRLPEGRRFSHQDPPRNGSCAEASLSTLEVLHAPFAVSSEKGLGMDLGVQSTGGRQILVKLAGSIPSLLYRPTSHLASAAPGDQ